MSRKEIQSWEFAGIKTCIDVEATVCESGGIVYDVLENYRCRNCGWEPTVSRYHISEHTQQLVFHAATCEEVSEPSAQEKAEQDAFDGLQYGDGYGGD